MSESGRRLARWCAGALLVMTIALWQWGGTAHALRPSTVAGTLRADRTLLTEATLATLRSTGLGLLAGCAIGVAAAWAAYLLPPVRALVNRTLLVGYVLPLVGVGPLLALVLDRNIVPVVSATVGVTFPVFATTHSGLLREPVSFKALLAVHGARRTRRLRLVTLPYSVPFVLDATRLAVPTALLGALIGEWFGADKGLGVLLASGMRDSQDDLVMADTVLVVAVSLAGYGLVSHLARAVDRRRGLTGGPA
ncbi:ABC transporter permease [Streptomyces sp. NPDC090106]|uniref:ABC transporter permease n=1 Tax=Streptomyces sp. NPDC090106 TaxID=3365946 RepID=UPI003812A8E7